MPTLQDTIDLVIKAHSEHNATDKGGKTPYHWHLFRVMLRLQTNDLELMQIALLHDVVEDTNITLDILREKGYSERVIEGVRWSSKNMFQLSFAEWMRAIGKQAPEDTVLLKIADISDNLGFERMQGLMGKKSKVSLASNNKKAIDLRQRIDKKVNQGMRLSGEMGVYERYYKGWNFMFENSDRLPLIEQVFIGDFCFLEQLKLLSAYIPANEYIDYLKLNKIHTWKVNGFLNIIQSKTGEDYLALEISEDIASLYVNFLMDKIDPQFIGNQVKRDRGHHHVTIINPMQFNKLKKDNPSGLNQFIATYSQKDYDLFTYGIGTAIDEKKQSQTWFTICENQELLFAREKLNLPKQDFHITLAFDKNDVFGKPKDRSSICFDNSILWKNFIQQFNYINKQHNFKKIKVNN